MDALALNCRVQKRYPQPVGVLSPKLNTEESQRWFLSSPIWVGVKMQSSLAVWVFTRNKQQGFFS